MLTLSIVIGLTGSIATGKSTVSNMFRDLGLPVVDADRISREVVEPGEKAYEEIVLAFGEDILLPDGSINRKKLGSVVFTNEEKRKQLNEIVHPEVRKSMLQKRDEYIEKGYNAVVLDIPLLFESKLTGYVDKTLVVFADEEVQLNRLMERDNSSKDEAIQRIQAQIPVKQKAQMADAVINNNGSIEETKEQLIAQLKKWNIL
jgi:dephospho-CoA kinase